MPTPVISRGRWTPTPAPSRETQYIKLLDDSEGEPSPSNALPRRLIGICLVVICIIGAAAFLWSSFVALVAPPSVAPGTRADNHLPIVRMGAILPSPLTREGPLSLRLETDDPDRDAISFQYQWIVNGHPLADQRGPTLDPMLVRTGDAVSAEVVPVDGKGKGPLHRIAAVTVVNTPPKVMQVEVQPDPLRAGDHVRAIAEVLDPDGDETRVLYRWWNNDALVAETESGVLSHVPIVRGDKIVVEVVPYDAEGPGKGMRTAPVEVLNGLPRITSTPTSVINDGRYVYTFSAIDPDGDTMTYALTVGPPGMVIDEHSGRIEWTLRAEDKGIHHVRIEVRDSHDGTAYQEFDVTVPTVPGA